ncbi:ABC transporter ATP-binding protein (plasmid) [Shinella sp. H4-D48]|uniref:ABC transporter ATP-binding protein n=1 Tax=Shinella sp. H4-D48 TaxID=2925841 RepID=UPI001F52C892|nr:ABC transporter ATP-binding protein [Shinella sp. H4-D48]UNK39959.1 ABC transporter ATP-binding protein [Shinella sp. H4-D48]
MTRILEVTNLTKSFGALTVAKDVSFDVAEGEVLGVIGPNGAGKTTLFGMLSGHITPSSGTVRFGGKDITTTPPHRRAQLGIGRTYQVPKPFGQMTVEQNLRVAATFAGQMDQRTADQWIGETLALTGLSAHAGALAGGLPLLVRKRHELARALAMRPRLLLIDEVAAGLTEEEVSAFITMVKSVRSLGIAVVWIEHVIRTMLTATDRLMVLADGQIVAVGSPEQVMALPETRRIYLGA